MTFPNIDPTAFFLFGIPIKWYGISYAISIFLGLLFCKFLSNKYKTVSKDTFEDALVWIVLGIIVGGRFGYVFLYDINFYLNNLSLIILGIREGGMSFHGGIIGVIIVSLIFCKIKKISFLNFVDIIACSAPLGLFLGRVANFINSELWGKKTDSFLGVIFPNGGPYPRHPSQLYEAFLEGIVLFIIINLVYRKVYYKKGYTSCFFLVFYGLFRIIVEFFREPDSHIGYIMHPFLSMGMLLCVPMILLGLIILMYLNAKTRKDFKKKY
tara:strand:- start:876 stop:1679 length:804 start_codon:yes stop_codon:yes gene_type:complete